jgi:hypothetical protein
MRVYDACGAIRRAPSSEGSTLVTLVWFVVWLIANNVGDREPLLTNPVNWWTATLILVIALDLGRQHASGLKS